MPSQSGEASPEKRQKSGGNAPPIAIDFGVSQMKVLQLSGGAVPSIVAAASLETPEEMLRDSKTRLHFQLRSLPALIRKCKIRPGRAVASLPMGQLFCKSFQFQATDVVPMAELAGSAVCDQLGCLPGMLAHQVIEVLGASRGGKTEVICLSASRDLVDRVLAAMVSAKLTPVGLHPEPVALSHCFDHTNRRADDQDKTTLYLDMGRGSTKIAINHGGKLVLCRGIEVGGLHLDEEVVNECGWSLDEACRLRRQMTHLSNRAKFAPAPEGEASGESGASEGAAAGVSAGASAAASAEEGASGGSYHPALAASSAAMGPSAVPEGADVGSPGDPTGVTDARPSGGVGGETDLLTDLTEPLEMLADEIAMCVRYHDGMFPNRRIDRAVFVGGESTHAALAGAVARTLNMPVEVADPLAQLSRTGSERAYGVDLALAQPGWAVALGMCWAPTDL